VASAILVAPIFIGIFRFIILNEVTHRYVLDVRSARFRVFCMWSIAFNLTTGGLLSVTSAYATGDLGVALWYASFGATFVLLVVFVPILPSVAVDAPVATLRNAIADIRRLFWRVFAILALTYLQFAAVLLLFLAVMVSANFAFGYELFENSIVMALITALVALCCELIWVAAAGRVFLALASDLRSSVSA
jgi:hypothetical protein